MNSDNLNATLFRKSAASASWLLHFLTLHPHESFYDKEISEKTGLSRGTTNKLLNQFFEYGLVTRERRGRMWFYSLGDNPLFKHYRIYENLVEITELVSALKPISRRVILFGSAARGDDTAESDIDVFVIAGNKDMVAEEIRRHVLTREIKPIIRTPAEYAISQSKDKTFFDQVTSGITLFDKEPDDERL